MAAEVWVKIPISCRREAPKGRLEREATTVPNGRPSLVVRRVASAEFTGAGAVRERAVAYRSEPTLRMLFFNRLRASASTWSFHR